MCGWDVFSLLRFWQVESLQDQYPRSCERKNKSSLVSDTDDAEDEDIYVVLYLSLLNRSTGRKKKVSMYVL